MAGPYLPLGNAVHFCLVNALQLLWTAGRRDTRYSSVVVSSVKTSPREPLRVFARQSAAIFHDGRTFFPELQKRQDLLFVLAQGLAESLSKDTFRGVHRYMLAFDPESDTLGPEFV
jgi:hypothetical protein